MQLLLYTRGRFLSKVKYFYTKLVTSVKETTIVKNSYNYTYFSATRACQHNSQVEHSYHTLTEGKPTWFIFLVRLVMSVLFASSLEHRLSLLSISLPFSFL